MEMALRVKGFFQKKISTVNSLFLDGNNPT
jgi:hypothetical protein